VHTSSGALPASVQSTVNVAGSVARTPSGFRPGPYIRALPASTTSSIGTLKTDPEMTRTPCINSDIYHWKIGVKNSLDA